jgi:hypothetical protein
VTVTDSLRPEPLGLREEVRSDVEESLELRESDEVRVLKPGRCAAEAGPKWLNLRGAGEYDRFADGGGEAEGVAAGVECPESRSSHISSLCQTRQGQREL